MFAIGHAAAALLVKRRFPEVPLPWLLGGAQAIELLWVGLNAVGVERTTTEASVASVADIHLAHMPWSHSLLGTAVVAAGLGLVAGRLRGARAGVAVSLAVLSHIVLDFVTHAPDIALTPWSDVEIGLGLYAASPLAAWVLELIFGIACWAAWRGSARLLAVIVGFNIANLTLMSAAVPGPEVWMAHRPGLVVAAVAAQIAVTLWLVHREAVPRTRSSGVVATMAAALLALGVGTTGHAAPIGPTSLGEVGAGVEAGLDRAGYTAVSGTWRPDPLGLTVTGGVTALGGWRTTSELLVPFASTGAVRWSAGAHTRSYVERPGVTVDLLGTAAAVVERERLAGALLLDGGMELGFPRPSAESNTRAVALVRAVGSARVFDGWSLEVTMGHAVFGPHRYDGALALHRHW